MKRLIIRILSLFLVAGILGGCAQNHFNIPVDSFAEQVKVLGIAPILIDTDSDIIHPQKEILFPLIADLNRKYEPLLARKLQSTGNFFAVPLQSDEPRQLFSSLVARREKRDDAGTQYNKYFWKNDEVGAYIKKNRLDAVMVLVVSGLTKKSKIYSSNLLSALETDYNFLTISAQMLGPDGTVLWEYPNFRGRLLLPYYPLVNLQYPDFSESEANLSHKTEVRFKSLDGIRRTLEQKKNDWTLRETPDPEVYGRLFDDMVSLIQHPVDRKVAESPAATENGQKSLVTPDKPAQKVPVPPAVSPQAVEAPIQPPIFPKSTAPVDPSTSGPIKIVPAAD
ncbi:MAG: hypothetical protein PHY09_00240 [Desulfuromonadaceae bacterium]|nr:hypothetical protein [Desulfuromonadaceae bacterium]MDD5105984.1 hypothetical protein [Desulfuromonadaceae bacterium]